MGSRLAQPDADAVGVLDTVSRLSRMVTRVLADLDPPLTVRQFRILTRLSRADAAIGALAARARVGPASMSQTIDSLVERGWVAREEDPEDRRRRTVRLTSSGRDVLASAERALAQQLSDLLVALSVDERRALTVGLAAVARELDRRWQGIVEGSHA